MTEHDLKTCVCADCCAARGARGVERVKVRKPAASGGGGGVLLVVVALVAGGAVWWSSMGGGGGGGSTTPGGDVERHYPDRKCRYPGGVVDVVHDVPVANWAEACAANGGVPAP